MMDKNAVVQWKQIEDVADVSKRPLLKSHYISLWSVLDLREHNEAFSKRAERAMPSRKCIFVLRSGSELRRGFSDLIPAIGVAMKDS